MNSCCLTLRENSDGKEASFDLLEETMERCELERRDRRQFGQPGTILACERARGRTFYDRTVDALGEIEVFEEREKIFTFRSKSLRDVLSIWWTKDASPWMDAPLRFAASKESLLPFG